jgi:ammonium transporter, Amt family
VFPGQVTTTNYLLAIFFAICAAAAILATLGLAFIDAGLSRRKNVIDAWLQKLAAGLVTAGSFTVVGYAVWNWQYYTALGTPEPLKQSFEAWWLGGTAMTHFAQTLDPKFYPQADVYQVFGVFFLAFAFFLGALLHSTGLERMRARVLFPVCIVMGGILWPLLSYLVWGSASPLTNSGLHDYTGVYSVYLFIGSWSVVIAWRLKPRLGALGSGGEGVEEPAPHDVTQIAVGVFLLLFSLPLIVLGSGYIVPGTGYFGISLTSSGFGIVMTNVVMSFIGGGIVGAILGYRLRAPIWVLLGPIAGYIANGALLDVSVPWKVLIVACFGPLAAYGTYRLLARLRIDDQKIGPLALGPGLLAAVASGILAANVKTGGYFGLTGKYGFQHARITFGWQMIGVAVAVGFGAGSALLLGLLGQRMRIARPIELDGLDTFHWGVASADTPLTIATNGSGSLESPPTPAQR